MNARLLILSFLGLTCQARALAAEATAVVSPTGNILKIIVGLAVVLAVMALLSWAVKRLLPNGAGQHSAIKVIGGTSVGSRERVVVLEVADRWLVVGVAQGQVNAIANLEAGSDQLAEPTEQSLAADQSNSSVYANPIVKPFSEWLSKSSQNIKNKR